MTANPTPLPPEGVTQADQQRASKWLARYEAGVFDLTLNAVAELCATTRIAATSAAQGEAYNRGVNDGVTEIEKTLHRILRTEWKPSNFQDPTAPTVMQMIDIFEARATKAEAANARLTKLTDAFVASLTDNGKTRHAMLHIHHNELWDLISQALDQGAEG